MNIPKCEPLQSSLIQGFNPDMNMRGVFNVILNKRGATSGKCYSIEEMHYLMENTGIVNVAFK